LTRAGTETLKVQTNGSPPVAAVVEVRVAPAAAASLTPSEALPGELTAAASEIEIVLQVRDALGNAVPDVKVLWRAAAGSGAAEPQESTSGPDGLVRTRWSIAAGKRREVSLTAAVAGAQSVKFETTLKVPR
jgi:hypothetical protein